MASLTRADGRQALRHSGYDEEDHEGRCSTSTEVGHLLNCLFERFNKWYRDSCRPDHKRRGYGIGNIQ